MRVIREVVDHINVREASDDPAFRPESIQIVVCSDDAFGRGLPPEELQQLLDVATLQRQAVLDQIEEYAHDSARAHNWTEPYALVLTWPEGYGAPQTVRFVLPWASPRWTASQRATGVLSDVAPAGVLEWPNVPHVPEYPE